MKKKRLNGVSLIVALLLLNVACKKEANKTISSPQGNSGTANISIENGLPGNLNEISGVLMANQFYYPTYHFTVFESDAGFSGNPMSLATMNARLNLVAGIDYVDTVRINGVAMKFETSNSTSMHRYSDTTLNANYSSGVNWNVKGNSSVEGFDANVTRGFPVIANASFIPTSFSKSQSLTINIGAANISNADSVSVVISSPQNGYGIIKTVLPSDSYVTFSPAELAGTALGAGSNQIMVFVKNYSHMNVTDKMQVFIMHNNLVEFVNIAP